MRSWRSKYDKHLSAEVFSIQYSLVITCTCFWGRVWCSKFCLGPWENEAGVPGMSGGYTTQKGKIVLIVVKILFTQPHVICDKIILKLHNSAPLWRICSHFNIWKKENVVLDGVFFSCEKFLHYAVATISKFNYF